MKFIKSPKTVGIIAGGFSGGQPKGGVEGGPSSLMDAGLVSQLQKLKWNVVIDPNTLLTYEHLKPAPSDHSLEEVNSIPPPLKNVRYTSAVARDVMKQVSAACSQGSLALTIGGDHSLAMGTISGSLSVYPDLGVVWVDAHADINTPETTTSGNLHGMPVSFLMGLAFNEKFNEWLPSAKLHPSRLVYIGLRDLDPGEKELLKKYNVKAFSMHEVDKYGIGKVMEMAMEYLGRDSPIHLSFDVDALDPSVCPSTGTPVRGGLTFREGHYINEVLAESGCLVAVDIMEVNPILGDAVASETTISVGLSLIRCALGETLPVISLELKNAVERRLKVSELKLFLSSLLIPPAGNKPELLGKFWGAFNKASAAFNRGNVLALKLFANAISKCGRMDIIQVLNLHTVKDIAGYQVTEFTPPNQMSEYVVFSTGPLIESPILTQLSQMDDPLTRMCAEVGQERPLTPLPTEQNTTIRSPIKVKLNVKNGHTLLPNMNKFATTEILDVKHCDHYQFEKPPTFTTIKCIKRHLVKESSNMLSPIYFDLDNSSFSRLKDDYRVRVFVAVIKSLMPEKEEEIVIPLSLPKSLKTFINGTVIYQERYMILNNNIANVLVSADVSLFLKQSGNSFKISWDPVQPGGYILISVELVKILNIDERVDQIIKKPKHVKILNGFTNSNTKDDELESTSEIITLRDPLSLSRIEKPGRSLDCKHLQFFDLKIWFTLNIKSEQFICPVCNRYRKWSSICFDEFYDHLLPQIPANIDKIEIFPDGKWECVDERRKPMILPAHDILDDSIHTEVLELVENAFHGFSDTDKRLKEGLIIAIEEWAKRRFESTKNKRRRTIPPKNVAGRSIDDPILISDSD